MLVLRHRALICLWSCILVQHLWVHVSWIDCRLASKSSQFLWLWTVRPGQTPCAKTWSDTESVSGSSFTFQLHSGGQELLVIWRWKSRARQLAPSRGSPAPVRGSGPRGRLDRTPSRTACSSASAQNKTQTRCRFNVKLDNLRQAYISLQMQRRCELWTGIIVCDKLCVDNMLAWTKASCEKDSPEPGKRLTSQCKDYIYI